jgi:hypothetical protein
MVDGVQFSVLVDVVQLAKSPQRMSMGILPSMVRLKRLDECTYFRRDGVETRGLVGGTLIPGGESNASWIGRRVATIDNGGKPKPNHVVKDSSKVVEAISEQRGDFRKWWPTDLGDVPNTLNYP